eukprot:TRINITY_DN4141_c0_g2_i1.p2 TRINITY_DN4141_c0_g2~~TRINITY_DN4141_c0_g2_i1.p2  ORF type:complete len:325 (+),score=143.22 TRINITY_DN4141_c0_g2_i1:96-1070(+)
MARTLLAAALAAALLPSAGGAKSFDKDEILRAMKEQKKKDQDLKDMLKKAGMDTSGMHFGSDFKNMDWLKNMPKPDPNAPPLPRRLGVVGLDAYSLDDVADGTRTVLLKIDKEYPYGEKEDEWRRLSERIADSGDLGSFVLAEVGVQEYGEDKYNEAVAQRFGVKPADYPAFRLLAKGAAEPVPYDGPVTVEGLSRFLAEKAGVNVPLPRLSGTIAALDDLAAEFTKAEGVQEQRGVLQRAKGAAKELPAPQQANAKYYLSVMKKMLARAQGEGVIVGCSDDEAVTECERKRIGKQLKDRKTAKEKKKELSDSLNILQSFQRQD